MMRARKRSVACSRFFCSFSISAEDWKSGSRVVRIVRKVFAARSLSLRSVELVVAGRSLVTYFGHKMGGRTEKDVLRTVPHLYGRIAGGVGAPAHHAPVICEVSSV